MFGYLLPFIQYTEPDDAEYYFRDCGPVMNQLLHTVPKYNLAIVDSTLMTPIPKRVSFPGFDEPIFPRLDVGRLRRKMFRLFNVRKLDRKEILMVDRKPPDAFFLTAAKVRGSGTSRRSVPNMPELFQRVSERYRARLVCLEGMDLKDQIQLFADASCIIAQHGAAVGHTLWCDAHTPIIQIGCEDPWFSQLFRKCRLRNHMVHQSHDHASIDVAVILELLRSLELDSNFARSMR